jgi:serine/threonine-protein kinase
MYDEIASGGMATVHFGRLLGALGFSRTVAIKHLHPQYSRDTEFVSMFLDEARLAARIQHPNVTVPLDVVLLEETEELFLIMEYIHGDNFARLLRAARAVGAPVLPSISASIVSGALHGLHAAHEAVNEIGVPLNIVHRDVSPQNIMVGVDGVSRVVDFGIAKAASRFQSTREGQMKGKFAYMAPEQMGSGDIDRRVDIFAAGIVLWEALTMKPLFYANDPGGVVSKVMNANIPRPSFINSLVSPDLDRVVMKALDRNVDTRFQTARDFATAIEEVINVAGPQKVGDWVAQMGGKDLSDRADMVSEIDVSSFDALVSSDPLQVLKSKRVANTQDLETKRDGNTRKHKAEQSASVGDPRQESVTALLPTPPIGLLPGVSPLAHGTRLAIAGAFLLALAVVVGAVGLSHRGRAKAAGDVSARALPEPQARPRTEVAISVAAAPTESPATASGAARLAVQEPPAAAAAIEPRIRAAAADRRSNAKIAAAGLSRTGKPQEKKNCDPPYYIDPNGIRRIRHECL